METRVVGIGTDPEVAIEPEVAVSTEQCPVCTRKVRGAKKFCTTCGKLLCDKCIKLGCCGAYPAKYAKEKNETV